jgi:Zn-dependent peptidase ImmA (M78 family)
VSESRKSAIQLLDELGITEPHEIDLEAIAAYCGAYVVYETLTGSEARIVGNHDKAFITVNNSSNEARKRFSIGHELGHWMWDRSRIAFECTTSMQDGRWFGTDKESLANQFSADLILPASMFRPRAHRRDSTLQTARELADEFQASLTATALRLVLYGTWPCMVVVHSTNGLEWHRATQGIDGRFWPCKQLDSSSFAYDLLRGAQTGLCHGLVDADVWINHPRAAQYEVIESSVLTSPDRVLTLLWWKNERMIQDLVPD